MQRETMEFDVLIVGAGPAGLSCAIRLKQQANAAQRPLSICVLEKGSEVGAHILSGAVIETRALAELFPDWPQMEAPLTCPVTEEQVYFLTKRHQWRLPTPPAMKNHGNYAISLGQFCRWLAKQAEALEIDIFAGYAAAELLFDETGRVAGVATGDMGRDRQGQSKAQFASGVEIRAQYTVLAEGCRGSLAETAMKTFDLRRACDPQTYGLGLKELWEIDPQHHRQGRVVHTIGWPLKGDCYGGSWLYFLENNLLSIGFVVGLDYQNPYFDPFNEFQQFKTHPQIRRLLSGGKRVSYGARALNEGGFQSIPKLTFPGGLLIGDAAGFLNVAKIKGTHTAMKSGLVAADALAQAFVANDCPPELEGYPTALQASWLWSELKTVRNLRPAFHYGQLFGLMYAGLDAYVFRGRTPWTFHHQADHLRTRPAANYRPLDYPKPDNVVSFDRLSSVYLSNTWHEENQPCHLQLQKPELAIQHNWAVFRSPEQRYCPAGVYEIVEKPDAEPHLQINAQNCVHCKTCDIKDPLQNIRWVVPEGGNGPNYSTM